MDGLEDDLPFPGENTLRFNVNLPGCNPDPSHGDIFQLGGTVRNPIMIKQTNQWWLQPKRGQEKAIIP